MTKEIYNALSEPFPSEVERTLSKSGTRLTYIPVSEVITRLNKVIGVDKWGSIIMSCERDKIDPDFIVAHVRLTANINGTDVIKDGIGGQKIKRTKNGDIVDLGDEMKGAVSDALKKAAQQLGVAIYLARSEEALNIDEQEQVQASRDPEIVGMWENFLKISRGLDADGKAELGKRWNEYSDGAPKPNIDTASKEELDFLIAEAQSIANGDNETSEPYWDQFKKLFDSMTDGEKAAMKEWWSSTYPDAGAPNADSDGEQLFTAITEAIRITLGDTK